MTTFFAVQWTKYEGLFAEVDKAIGRFRGFSTIPTLLSTRGEAEAVCSAAVERRRASLEDLQIREINL